VAAAGSLLSPPPGEDRAIDSERSPAELAGLIRDAATRGRVSSRVDGSPYVVRLGGTVDGLTVDLEARLLRADGSAGRPKRPLRVTGAVREGPGGSTLDVRIAPDDRSTITWVVAIPAVAVVLMLLARVPPLAISLIGSLAVPNVLLAVRASQRFPLRYVSQVEALLEAIARGA
jgi:hypothetical protein